MSMAPVVQTPFDCSISSLVSAESVPANWTEPSRNCVRPPPEPTGS
jgi:hypothetical protein